MITRNPAPLLSLLSTFYPKSNDDTERSTDKGIEKGTDHGTTPDNKNGGQVGHTMGSAISLELQVGLFKKKIIRLNLILIY